MTVTTELVWPEVWGLASPFIVVLIGLNILGVLPSIRRRISTHTRLALTIAALALLGLAILQCIRADRVDRFRQIVFRGPLSPITHKR